jgi:type III restriction enzyme
LSQYRYKLFQKWALFIKPVILFKSKTIKESEAFLEEFTAGIKALDTSKLKRLDVHDGDKAIRKVFQYLAAQNITLENFIAEIQVDFSEGKLMVVNSREESEKKQLAVNTLEEETNPYRAIFAVDKLNEGWDVLNLFDIVRLYNTADATKSAWKKTTLSEAQLIGRGARYCPFRIAAGQPLAQRKFDDNPDHELRIGEELYYHSPYNPRYIHELNHTLVQVGIRENELHKKVPEQKAIFYTEEKKKSDKPVLANKIYKVHFSGSYTSSHSLFNEEENSITATKSIIHSISVLPEPVLRKAIDRIPFYYFDNLKKLFPQLRSVQEFIQSNEYLGSVRFELRDNIINELSAGQKLIIAIDILEQAMNNIM